MAKAVYCWCKLVTIRTTFYNSVRSKIDIGSVLFERLHATSTDLAEYFVGLKHIVNLENNYIFVFGLWTGGVENVWITQAVNNPLQ